MDNGAKLKGVNLTPTGSGYGVLATEHIANGEMFVDIPAKLAMNERSALRTPVAQLIADMYGDASKTGAPPFDAMNHIQSTN